MHARLFRRLAACTFSLIAIVLLHATPAAAQPGQGSVEGVATGAEEGAPLAFSLIRLVPVDSQAAAPQGVLTDAAGRYRFAAVPAAAYRVQVEQIGYERVLSAVLQVRPGETLRHDVRATLRPIRLEAISTASRCLAAAQLAEDPELSALWNEAKKGVETRRAFERQYGFVRILTQDVETRWRLRGTRRERRVDTVVSEPDSVAVRDLRRRASLQNDGYAEGNTLRLPEEKQLLEDEFLRDHCLESSFDEDEGTFAIRFRPIRPRRSGVGIRGTIRVDARTYLIRRLEIDYLKGTRAFATGSIEYADLPIAGSTLRLPVSGRAVLRASGVTRALVSGASSAFTYAYRDVRAVRAN